MLSVLMRLTSSIALAAVVIYLQNLELIPRGVLSGMRHYKYKSSSELMVAFAFYAIIIYSIFYLLEQKVRRDVDAICPHCEFAMEVKRGDSLGSCPKCGTQMVKLKGFYDKKE